MKMKTLWDRRWLFFLCVFPLIFLVGPRPHVNIHLNPVNLPVDLDAFLAQSESRYPDIIPGTEKTIIWANAAKSRTPLAIVYLHGYSASRQETVPLCEKLAARWGANIFYTRLTGHGRSAQTLVDAQVNDLLNDVMEAVAIGKRLGNRVIVIGNSAGGALSAWLAAQPGNDDVLAYVLLSPAVGFKHPLAGLLTGPWAEQLARLVVGAEYGHVSSNSREERFWITHYPSRGIIIPAMLAKTVRQSAPERIYRPVLVIYSPLDQLVAPEAIERFFQRIGSVEKKMVVVPSFDFPENHVLAGDIRAPQATDSIVALIDRFVSEL